jgi:two-component system cell cycle sensor histidine kinase/response regulator CckA
LEALEQKNGAVDLVVSDVVMPELDGQTLLKMITRSAIPTSRSSSFRVMRKIPSKRACQQFAFPPKPLGQLVATVGKTIRPDGRSA